MGETKRQKARRLEEYKRWEEYVRKNPPPPPPPWTEGQLAQMDQMKSILDKLTISQGHDIDLVSDFLRLSYLFEGNSQRIPDLQRKVAHYRELEQYAAKEKLWSKIYGIFSGLKTELHYLRISRKQISVTTENAVEPMSNKAQE